MLCIMSYFKIVLDKRAKRKSEKFDLCVRYTKGNEVMYLKVAEMDLVQYKHVFEKKSMDRSSIDFRQKCNEYINRCERLYSDMKPFDRKEFRELFFERKKSNQENNQNNKSLLLKDMFKVYMTESRLKVKTAEHYKTTINVFESFQPNLVITDITPEFLENFSQSRMKKSGLSRATIDSYMRNLRAVINYYFKVIKNLPKEYEYPFGKGHYIVSSYFPPKQVLTNNEIKKIIDFENFDTKEQRYARDIWVSLYRMNGINFADLFRLKWDDIKGTFIVITRQKTETTRKNNIKPIVIPYNEKVVESIRKIGCPNFKYVLGIDIDCLNEKSMVNKLGKCKQKINKDLNFLTKKLNLSVPLNTGTARDAYATTLLRADKPIEQISEMLGHSNVIVTNHYLGARSIEQTFEINDVVM